jgi:hypothetical protein
MTDAKPPSRASKIDEDESCYCEGFTRPQCQPCLNEDVRVVRVATVKGDQDKRLCAVCIARLLPPLGSGGWKL